MYKECKVILLKSNEASNIQLLMNNKLHYENGYSVALKSYKHIYIVSEETPKANDWCVNDNEDTVYQINGLGDISGWNKIIATTDVLPIYKSGIEVGLFIPQLPQQFIEKYIEEYNKGNIISEVEVEYEQNVQSWINAINKPAKDFIQLKVNTDNTINIKPIKTSWNRDEHIANIKDFAKEFVANTETAYKQADIDKWINDNL